MTFTPGPQAFFEIGLFTGIPQHENFCRIDEIVSSRAMAPSSTPRPWPGGNDVALDETFGFNGAQSDTAQFLSETDTAALLVLKDGVVRHESYFLTGGPDVRWISMSVAKSFTSALVGIALQEGLIASIEEPISDYVRVEAGSAYDGVSIRSVLQMSSGARWHEDYSDPESDIVRLGAAAAGANGGLDDFVATMSCDVPPDTLCRYNSADTQALTSLLRSATGENLADFMQSRLVEPLGFTDPGAWLVDPHGVELGFGGLALTARDYARIGELYRNGGRVGDQQVVAEEWVTASLTASAPHLQSGVVVVGGHTTFEGYGYQWWLPPGDRGEFDAVGVYNQFVYVDPTAGVTIVKLSSNRTFGLTEDEPENREEETTEFLRAVARQFE
ncbi:MAG: serine hydrolase [Actinobacteria bacterium]|nr:serine hydrolase [Actinomycetota bacterium]